MKITRTIAVECPRSRMWALLTETELIQRWNTDILRDEVLTEGAIGVGSRSRVLIREGSKEVWYDNEILAYDEPNALTIQLTGGSLGDGPMTIRYSVAGDDGRLTVTFDSEWAAHGVVLRLMAPLISIMGRRNADGAMRRLKHVAESES